MWKAILFILANIFILISCISFGRVLPWVVLLLVFFFVTWWAVNAIRVKWSRHRGRLAKPSWIGVGVASVVTAAAVAVISYGNARLTSQIEDKLRNNPVLVAHLGTIDKGAFSMDLAGSFAYDESDILVCRVRGSRGEGLVTVNSETINCDEEKIIWAWLTTPSGDTFGLVGEGEEMSRSVARKPAPLWIGVVAGIVLAAAVAFFGHVISGQTAEMEEKLRNNPVLVAHLGSIEKGAFATDWNSDTPQSKSKGYISDFRVRGSRGEGRVTVNSEFRDGGDEKIIWAKLTTAAGQTIELVTESPETDRTTECN